MYYTIYTAMEIVKAFNSNDLHANITIKGTKEHIMNHYLEQVILEKY